MDDSGKSMDGTTGPKPGQQKKGQQSNMKLIIPAVAGGIALISVALLGFVTINSVPDKCEKFLSQFSKDSGKKVTVALDPISRRQCLQSQCTFNYAECLSPCPFGFLNDEHTQCPTSCECAESGSFQGDIQFDKEELPRMMKDYGHAEENDDFELFFGWGGNLWNEVEVNGRYKIPYEIDGTITADLYKVFDLAIRNMSERTCLDYVPRTENEKDYLYILNAGTGCETYLGRTGGKQLVKLPDGCFFEATIQHELMHSIGFYHEQSREDRDAYVDIFWDNIHDYATHNFDKQVSDQYIDLGSEYELLSGLHYMSHCFAKDKSRPTIVGKGNVLISHKEEESFLSAEDFREIRLLYECEDTGPPKKGEWDEWNSWSECTQTCGAGKRQRYRHCIHQPDGEKLVTGCPGLPSDYEMCNPEECPPLTGEWEDWASWGACSVTCGQGRQLRSRGCTEIGACTGLYFDYQSCYDAFCDTGEKVTTETFGTWTEWGRWFTCDQTCGRGKQATSRTCARKNEKLPIQRCKVPNEPNVSEYGNSKYRECELRACPGEPAGPTTIGTEESYEGDYSSSGSSSSGSSYSVPSGLGSSVQWGEWTEYTDCDVTCGVGQRKRERICPTAGSCLGVGNSFLTCNMGPCSGGGGSGSSYGGSGGSYGGSGGSSGSYGGSGGSYGGSGGSSGSYGGSGGSYGGSGGSYGGGFGGGSSTLGWGEWGSWTTCDKSCGSGSRLRTRTCRTSYCPGFYKETDSCTETQCPQGGGEVFSGVSMSVVKNVCPYGKLFFGIFNKDPYPDLLCFYADGFARLYYTDPFKAKLGAKVDWEGTTLHCSFTDDDENTRVSVRDLNRDGLDDLVCHNQVTKEIIITLNKNGVFQPWIDWRGKRKRCGGMVMYLEMDGDGNIDLVCGDENNSFKYVYLNNF